MNILEFETTPYCEFHPQYEVSETGTAGLLETYGHDLGRVSSAPPKHVWTVVDGSDSDDMYIVAGQHFVNRVAYFLSEIPWADENEVYLWHSAGS